MKISTQPEADDYQVHGLWNTKKEEYNNLKPKAVITAEILQENIFDFLCSIREDLIDMGKEITDLRERIDAK